MKRAALVAVLLSAACGTTVPLSQQAATGDGLTGTSDGGPGSSSVQVDPGTGQAVGSGPSVGPGGSQRVYLPPKVPFG